jgi:hypothetical protein
MSKHGAVLVEPIIPAADDLTKLATPRHRRSSFPVPPRQLTSPTFPAEVSCRAIAVGYFILAAHRPNILNL